MTTPQAVAAIRLHLFAQGLEQTSIVKDLAIVYFAGHGVLGKDGTGKWIVSDSKIYEESTYVNLTTVKDLLLGYRSKTKALFVDACFTGIGPAEPSR